MGAEGERAVELVRLLKPEVVLLDVEMPGKLGPEQTLCRLLDLSPQPTVVILNMHDQPALADDLLRHGAGGLLPKSASIQELFAEVSRSHRTLHFEIVPLDLRSLTRAKTLSSEAAGGFPQHLHLDAYACHQKVRGRR